MKACKISSTYSDLQDAKARRRDILQSPHYNPAQRIFLLPGIERQIKALRRQLTTDQYEHAESIRQSTYPQEMGRCNEKNWMEQVSEEAWHYFESLSRHSSRRTNKTGAI